MRSVVDIDSDAIFEELVKAIYKDSDINVLGKALEFKPADIGRATEENTKQGDNYMGTLDMLRTWQKRQTPSTEKAALRSALLKAGFKELADKYLSTPVTDKTTSYPSLPNTITSTSTATTTPTTTATTTTPTHKAFLVITLLIWAAVSVSGTTPELSTTTGDTVNIPCLFGEGTLHYILWSYSISTGRHNILMFTKGEFTIEADYANRASLKDDYSTLILKEITVADEGTYHCVVDTLKQTAVSKINTKLNVFSLRPDTHPMITPCTGADESSSCSIHANQSVNLTCTLPNVYPVEDTELIWYQDGKHVSSIPDVMQNDNGTTDISRQIQIFQTGNFTCNATYISANGRENTAVSVKAWIIPPADVPDTPGKDMTSSLIVWKVICFVLVAVLGGISLTIIARFLYHLKARGQRFCSKHLYKSDETQLNQVTSTKELKLLETSAENGSNDRNAESSEPTKRPIANRSKNEEVTSIEELKLLETSAENGSKDGNEASELLWKSAENGSKDENVDRPASSLCSNHGRIRNARRRNVNRLEQETTITDETLSGLAEALNVYKNLPTLGLKLGFRQTEVENYMSINKKNRSFEGTTEMLLKWKRKTLKAKQIPDLVKALDDSGLAKFVSEFIPARDFNDILLEVAKRVRKDSEIDTLGIKLGFSPQAIQRYIATNQRTQNVTFDGTLQMLRDWQKRQTSSTERGYLKTALEQSGQSRLAADLLPSSK